MFHKCRVDLLGRIANVGTNLPTADPVGIDGQIRLLLVDRIRPDNTGDALESGLARCLDHDRRAGEADDG
jgi:hypothetical protein